MADTTLRLRFPTGAQLYTQIESGAGVWNGTSFVSFATAGWSTYATATPETPASSGRYVCQFPLAAPPGNYSWSVYLRSGSTPALADAAIGQGGGYWDGATFGNTPASNLAPVQVAVDSVVSTLAGYDQLLLSGSVNDPAPSTTRFVGSSSFATDSNYYNGRQVCFTSGDLQGLKQPISTYVGSTRTFTVSPGFPFAPANGDPFTII